MASIIITNALIFFDWHIYRAIIWPAFFAWHSRFFFRHFFFSFSLFDMAWNHVQSRFAARWNRNILRIRPATRCFEWSCIYLNYHVKLTRFAYQSTISSKTKFCVWFDCFRESAPDWMTGQIEVIPRLASFLDIYWWIFNQKADRLKLFNNFKI